MSAPRHASVKKQEEIASLCAEIVRRIRTEEDPAALNEYRSILKKNVPFFLRSYFAAFLLKQLLNAVPSGDRKPQSDRSKRRREAPAAAEPRKEEPRKEEPHRKEDAPKREDVPRRVLPESEAATLFVGVGRNRRAYARDLLAFIVGNAGLDADAVGELRVLDNFSFVQIRKDVADTAIEKLNGMEFRGRSVSVSYAKPRKEEAKEDTPTFAESSESDESDEWMNESVESPEEDDPTQE